MWIIAHVTSMAGFPPEPPPPEPDPDRKLPLTKTKSCWGWYENGSASVVLLSLLVRQDVLVKGKSSTIEIISFLPPGFPRCANFWWQGEERNQALNMSLRSQFISSITLSLFNNKCQKPVWILSLLTSSAKANSVYKPVSFFFFPDRWIHWA